jgi:iron(III) transport system substrate-binding protein
LTEEKKVEEKIPRRKFLNYLGAVSALAAVGWGTAGYLATRPPSKVLETKTLTVAPPTLLEKAKAEGKATFYANITAVEPIIDEFKKTYSVDVEYLRIGTDKFLATVLTEYEAGKLKADVLQAPSPIVSMLKDRGILAPHRSPSAEVYPDSTRDQEGIVQTFAIEYIALIYNKDLVKAQDAPRRYEDLLDPKWKGKIVMPDPSAHATTIEWLIGLKEKVFDSEDKWRAFVNGLATQKPMFVASLAPTPDPIARGEVSIGISMPKYIITKAPAPLDWARTIDQPLLGTPRGIAISKTAPNPNAEKLFLDFWLSRKAMKMLADMVGEYVLYPGIYPPIKDLEKATVLPTRMLSEDEITRWAAEFKKTFG